MTINISRKAFLIAAGGIPLQLTATKMSYATDGTNPNYTLKNVPALAINLQVSNPVSNETLSAESWGILPTLTASKRNSSLKAMPAAAETAAHYHASLGLELIDELDSETVVIHKESDASESINVSIDLSVIWGASHSSIQIAEGTFLIESKDPFVSFSNAFYAIMQKDKYIGSDFNGAKTTVKTGWDSDSFNSETDQWTCGAGCGGGGFSLLTGYPFDFALDCYLE